MNHKELPGIFDGLIQRVLESKRIARESYNALMSASRTFITIQNTDETIASLNEVEMEFFEYLLSLGCTNTPNKSSFLAIVLSTRNISIYWPISNVTQTEAIEILKPTMLAFKDFYDFCITNKDTLNTINPKGFKLIDGVIKPTYTGTYFVDKKTIDGVNYICVDGWFFYDKFHPITCPHTAFSPEYNLYFEI